MFGLERQGPTPSRRGGAALYVPGAALLGIGFLILVMPDLLRYLVAGCFLALGAVGLAAAHQLRRGTGTVRLSRWLDRGDRPFGS